MTAISRDLIRKMIIQEMRLSAPSRPKLTSGLSFDDDKTLDIDNETEIEDVPSFMGGFDDATLGVDDKTEFDFDTDLRDFGIDYDDDDSEFEFESETEEDSESETEYNPGREAMGMSRDEIRRHVTSVADKLSSAHKIDKKTRAEMRYDDLVKQGRESDMTDPEFMNTDDLNDLEDTMDLPADRKPRRPPLSEHINKRIRQSIRRQILLL